MANFVLLYSGGGMPETEEEQAKVMKAWTDWFAQLGPAVKDGGDPFTRTARTVSHDGSIAEATGTLFTGYSILTADSLDAAMDLAKGSPILQGNGSITIYETLPTM